MLSEICFEIKNYFCRNPKDKHFGDFKIENGVISPSYDLKNGQYYRVYGSVFNDGVHKFGDSEDVLTDEEFNGSVWLMKVPQDFLNLATEIEEWCKTYSEKVSSPYQSESFGGYSYSKASGSHGNITWQDAFATRLSMYRRIRL